MEPSIPILTLTKDLVHKQHQLKEAVSLAIEGDMDMSIVAKHSVIFPCHSSLLVLFSPLVARLLSEVPCCLSPTIFLPDFSEIHITKLLHLLESGQAISGQNVDDDIEIITEIAQVLQISVIDINTEPYLGNSFEIKKEVDNFSEINEELKDLNEKEETESVIHKQCEEMEDYVYVEREVTEKTPFVGTIKTEVADTVTSEVSIGMETNIEEDMIEIKTEVIDREETNGLDHNDRRKETDQVNGEVTAKTNVNVEENKSRENCLGFISSVTSLAQKSVSSRSRRGSLLVLPTQGSKVNESRKSHKENFDQKHMKVKIIKIKKADTRNRFNFEENIHMEKKDANRGEIDDDLELKKHMKTQAREKRHLCKYCKKKFKNLCHLKEHRMIHTGEKPFLCELCPKRFRKPSHLKEHTIIHTEEKPFPCELCPKRFTRSSQLKEHTMYHHKGEKKPFPCEVCPKMFTQPSFLKVHMRTHTGEKPFQCQVCPKRFANSGHLKEHTRTHTGEKPFQCKFCPKKFAKSSSLKIHIKIHTEPKRNNSRE